MAWTVWVEVEPEEGGDADGSREPEPVQTYETEEEAREVQSLLTGPGVVERLRFVDWLDGSLPETFSDLWRSWQEANRGEVLEEMLGDEFTRGYLEAMAFTGCPPEDFDLLDLELDVLEGVREDCEDFVNANAAHLETYTEFGYTLGQAGHDFWLTRNGHGAGFWDRDARERFDVLTAAAKAYGDVDLYRIEEGGDIGY